MRRYFCIKLEQLYSKKLHCVHYIFLYFIGQHACTAKHHVQRTFKPLQNKHLHAPNYFLFLIPPKHYQSKQWWQRVATENGKGGGDKGKDTTIWQVQNSYTPLPTSKPNYTIQYDLKSNIFFNEIHKLYLFLIYRSFWLSNKYGQIMFLLRHNSI